MTEITNNRQGTKSFENQVNEMSIFRLIFSVLIPVSVGSFFNPYSVQISKLKNEKCDLNLNNNFYENSKILNIGGLKLLPNIFLFQFWRQNNRYRSWAYNYQNISKMTLFFGSTLIENISVVTLLQEYVSVVTLLELW